MVWLKLKRLENHGHDHSPARLTSMSSQAEAIISRLAGLPVPRVIPLVSATWLVLRTPKATCRLSCIQVCRSGGETHLGRAKLEVQATPGSELDWWGGGGEEDVTVPHGELVDRIHQDVGHLTCQIAVHQVGTGRPMAQLPDLLHVHQHLLHARVKQRQPGIDQRDVIPDDVLRLHSIGRQTPFHKGSKGDISEEVARLQIHEKGIKAKLPAKSLLDKVPEHAR